MPFSLDVAQNSVLYSEKKNRGKNVRVMPKKNNRDKENISLLGRFGYVRTIHKEAEAMPPKRDGRDGPAAKTAATMPPKVGRGKAKADAAVEEQPAAKKAATMPPKGGGRGRGKADAAVEEEPAAKKAATMPPKVGKGKEKDVATEPAAKTAATMPPKGGPGYLQLALDALETLGTATWPKLTKWIESERPEVDFKPHLLKAALKKAVEKGAPPLCHRSARARCTRRRRIACRDTSVAPRCGLGCTRLHDSACRRAHRDRILRPRHACAAPRVPLLSRPLFSHRHHQTGQEPLYTL